MATQDSSRRGNGTALSRAGSLQGHEHVEPKDRVRVHGERLVDLVWAGVVELESGEVSHDVRQGCLELDHSKAIADADPASAAERHVRIGFRCLYRNVGKVMGR